MNPLGAMNVCTKFDGKSTWHLLKLDFFSVELMFVMCVISVHFVCGHPVHVNSSAQLLLEELFQDISVNMFKKYANISNEKAQDKCKI